MALRPARRRKRTARQRMGIVATKSTPSLCPADNRCAGAIASFSQRMLERKLLNNSGGIAVTTVHHLGLHPRKTWVVAKYCSMQFGLRRLFRGNSITVRCTLSCETEWNRCCSSSSDAAIRASLCTCNYIQHACMQACTSRQPHWFLSNPAGASGRKEHDRRMICGTLPLDGNAEHLMRRLPLALKGAMQTVLAGIRTRQAPHLQYGSTLVSC